MAFWAWFASLIPNTFSCHPISRQITVPVASSVLLFFDFDVALAGNWLNLVFELGRP